MSWNLHTQVAQDGDLASLVGKKYKQFIITLIKGAVFQSHKGVVKHDDLIGLPWGSCVHSHTGSPFYLMQPLLGDILREIPRATQILYAKDIGYILVTMGIGPGVHVLEAGTGSGALTTAFAFCVGSEGHVTSYDIRQDMQKLAYSNLARVGLLDRVTLNLGDIGQGFEETGVDALFLDVPNPYDYLPQVKKALKPGGFFGCILPTMNQVMILLTSLRRNNFAFVDVCEILLRFYQAEPERLRPADRMVAHTGYLTFGRPVLTLEPELTGIKRKMPADQSTTED